MKKNYLLILLISTSVLASGLLLSNVKTASAVGTIDSSVTAGDNYWYTVTEFTPIQSIVDNILQDALNVDELPEGFDYSFTGGLQGSEIYVKVIDINSESMTYWDGSNEVVGTLPTIDVTAGLITGQAMSGSVDVPDENGDITTLEAALPAGLGLPLPLVFGSATALNVSSVPDLLLPVPFILNNDFDTHETVLNQLKTMFDNEGIPGSISVTSDSILSIAGNSIQIDEQGHMFISFLVSWRKSDGALQEINLQINNQTSGTEFLKVDIDLNRKENKPLYVEVGDTFTVDIDDLGFDYSLSGLSGNDSAGLSEELDNIRNSMAGLVGQTLIDFEVVDIDGLWYQVEGFVYDGELDEMVAVPGPDTTGDVELWMLGFGRLGPGMPQNFMFGGFGESSFGPDVRRAANLPGIVVTPDWQIYQAWDLTETTAAELGSELFVNILEIGAEASQTDDNSDWIDFSSSTTDTPVFDASFSSTVDANGYSVMASLDVDMVIEENNTWGYWYYNETSGEDYFVEDGWSWNNVAIDGFGSITTDYDLYGTFEGVSVSGQFTVSTQYEDSDGYSGAATVSVSNARADISVNYVPLNARPPLDEEGNPSTNEGTPEAFVGLGFNVVAALMSFSLIGMVMVRRRN